MIITPSMLTKHKACAEQVAIFKKQWPKGAELTVDNLVVAQNLGLDIHWLVSKVFPQYREAYRKVIVPYWEAYEKAKATSVFNLLKE